MDQWLGALGVVLEDLDSILSTHMVPHTHLKLQFRGLWCPLLTSMSPRPAPDAQTDMQAKHLCIE